MKKKSIKSLRLNKKSISNLQKETVSGGISSYLCYIAFKKAFDAGYDVGVSLAGTCQSDACITDNDEYSCACTIA